MSLLTDRSLADVASTSSTPCAPASLMPTRSGLPITPTSSSMSGSCPTPRCCGGRHASARPEEAASVLARSLAVRNALYRLFKATIEGWRPDGTDVTTFNRELRIARAHERLAASSRLRWEWDEPSALDRVLWPIVREAAVLLTGPDLDKVRQCPGTECGWLFYDASRSGRRQWCDMATCGNFAKVQRFRDRQRRARSAVLRTTSSSKMRRMQ